MKPIISHLIAAAGRSGYARYEHDGPKMLVPWAISDVQLVHRSVFPGKSVLAIRIRGQPGAPPSTPVSSTTPAATTRKKTSRLGSAANIVGAFGFRSRGKTISGEDSRATVEETPFDIYELTHGPNASRSSPSTASLVLPKMSLSPILTNDYKHIFSDRTVYLRFNTEKEREEFFAIFRSFCAVRTLDEPDTHRRLSISIYDLIESSTDNTKRLADHENDGVTEKWSKMSRGETHATTGYMESSVMSGKAWRPLKPGWTHKDQLCIEV